MTALDVSACKEALDPLCLRVGLVGTALPQLSDVPPVPAGAALWTSSYAQLLLWPVAETDSAAITRGAEEGEGWLDAALARAEQEPGAPVDGYLVLALPEVPANADDVRRIELSARICRKHLVWPSPADALAAGASPWARVADVTVLGLPDAVTAANDTLYWPKLEAEAAALWNDLQDKGALAAAEADAVGPADVGSAS